MKALAAGAAAALVLAGTASAATHRAPSKILVSTHRHVTVSILKTSSANGVVAGGFLNAAVTYLGIDRSTLVADLKAGQSLAQIATAQGKTADGLVTALLAPAKLKLDAAVTAGKLNAAREATLLSKLHTALSTIVTKAIAPKPSTTTKPHPPLVPVSAASIIQAATSYLGVDLKTVISDLAKGQTLAQIAAAQGKTADGLTGAIVAAAKTKLDAQLAAGRITQQQETASLAQFQTTAAAFASGSLQP